MAKTHVIRPCFTLGGIRSARRCHLANHTLQFALNACTVIFLIAATLYFAAAPREFTPHAKFLIWHLYIWLFFEKFEAPQAAPPQELQGFNRGAVQVLQNFTIFGLNLVVVAQNGLILWENGARHSKKVSKYLPSPQYSLKASNKYTFDPNPKNSPGIV